mmetsp:Transcript_11841/g.38029  ORF Transcript_11841/g.38029 Transcript_11841/m.38029 type:complete len:370 (-) Transcript_11841:104-1213(-)
MPPITPADGPVAVTGASGYIGAHVVLCLLKRGYTVHACVRNKDDAGKTAHLLDMTHAGHPGSLKLFSADVLETGSYDVPFKGCSAVMHVGTPMGYGNQNGPRAIYDGGVRGTRNVVESVKRSGSVKRIVYTSSFAAIGHPAPLGHKFTEEDWATDSRGKDWNFAVENIDTARAGDDEFWYQLSKVETEKLLYRTAHQEKTFDAMTVCPIVVLGPLLCRAHELVGSWQWQLGRMLRGKPAVRAWANLWNITDVRDVAMAHVLIAESGVSKNGSRYQLTAANDSGMLDVDQLQAELKRQFPGVDVGGAPPQMEELRKRGAPFRAPIAYCEKAVKELGLQTHPVADTLRQTGETLIHLGICKPKYTDGQSKL